jgi:Ca2+-binding RTX toxin-like protein
MSVNRLVFFSVLGLLVLVGFSLLAALSAANLVDISHAGSSSSAITPNALKPPECATLNLTRLVDLGNGDTPSDSQSELILGTSGKDTIDNSTAALPDCVLGGDDNDKLIGGLGGDVLNGGPGNDHCWGGGGATTTFLDCEHVH